ncbi:MAG: glycosyltransferase [Burkholderiales bacterium]|nr:glycosyltransferase [Burkholderiales bacterium]
MKTAFVVLTYNRVAALLPVLRALAAQCGKKHEVLVADDGSSPAHVRRLQDELPRFGCRVRHVWHPDVGFTAARARNLAAARSEADYLVFLDGDCVPAPGFVQMHRRLAETGCFVNGSRVMLSRRLSQQAETGHLDLAKLGAGAWLRLRLGGDVNKLTHLVHWPGAPGRVETRFRWKGIRSCNFGLWRRDFEAVNGFDEGFSGWGHEDADLVLRLHHQGLKRKNGFCATEVFHLWHPESDRGRESDNRERVMARMKTGIIRSGKGLDEARPAREAVVTELN